MGAVHPRVLGYLGRALSLELSAVQQYMTQASLVELWGEAEAATRFRRETVEELQHAEQIVQRMLALGVAPAASQLRPVGHAPDLAGLLRLDLTLEADLIQHYAEAVRFCVLVGDAASEAFFQALWTDEQHHAEELGAWLRSLGPNHDPSMERATF
ncbi:ferritin-like domain-containing protein [Cyanobium sp. FACHB-13342]|uniref:ferritin-like domain-containing protein n=1 Tax=Cyanobium sp. FACHB-13342 TaxID=2692793 RepID=UPI0016818CEF|nr:ferritin-like domain-containing protein [Cyanobium sp. FACHB-13342]MBD2421961.1 bacterioferritin [Cyanobium sp. FACHB-13342]